jgi:hypothetical protein
VDLKNSFIQQKLDVEHMYMECPDGYTKQMENGEPAAMHCLQSIYGLKQSSRLLHQRLSKFLRASGFKQLISDQCVYTKGAGNDQVIVCCWVDDIILASGRENHAARIWFDTSLRKEFVVSPWTPGVEASWILNMKIQRNWREGTLHLSQPAAIEKLAAQFKLTENVGRGPWVPMDPNLKLEKTATDKVVPPQTWDYQSAVGAMLYLSLTARPDIALCTVRRRVESFHVLSGRGARDSSATGDQVPVRHEVSWHHLHTGCAWSATSFHERASRRRGRLRVFSEWARVCHLC